MRFSPAILSALIAALISLVSMFLYVSGSLGHNFSFYYLPAEQFGVPEELEDRGLDVLFLGQEDTGWDGQFHYYIANDLLAQKDTPDHVDTPAYRYQRIGLSLYAAGFATLFGQDWVSPGMFYISYLVLIVAATWAASRLVMERGGFAWTGLLWGGALGTQLTLLNALPDASADAFLILGTAAFLWHRKALGLVLVTMAALSRETYILFPAMYLAWMLWQQVEGKPLISWPLTVLKRVFTGPYLILLLPMVVFLFWQGFVFMRFGILGSGTGGGVLGMPFVEWSKAFFKALTGSNDHWPDGAYAGFELAALVFFMFLMVTSLVLALAVVGKRHALDPWIVALALGSLVLIALYASFGWTVIEHPYGYLKVLGLFLFLIPLFMAELEISLRIRIPVYSGLIAVVCVCFSFFAYERLDPTLYHPFFLKYSDADRIAATGEKSCLEAYNAEVRLVGMEDFYYNSLPIKLNRLADRKVYWVDLTNRSGEPFTARHAKGAVNMSYNWVARDNGAVVLDGARTMIPEGLPDGATVRLPLVIEFPEAAGDYMLYLSPVQEGCAWFYQQNPDSAFGLEYRIR